METETSLILISIGFFVCVAIVAAILFMPSRPDEKEENEETWQSPCPSDDDLFFDPSFSSLSFNIYHSDDE